FFDYVSQEKKFELYAKAKAVLFIPMDEDYGYITLEAMAASKMVITAKDSGGPLEFVEDGKSGIVCDPTPQSIAEVIDDIAKSDAMAKQFGQEAKKHLDDMDITWEKVVRELTR
ncbi:MAG: glycosyltransferase, partial [Lachnospiraceae bacterium]|nr:glycosyltransferase [Lachnospiraceae bacterium]